MNVITVVGDVRLKRTGQKVDVFIGREHKGWILCDENGSSITVALHLSESPNVHQHALQQIYSAMPRLFEARRVG